MSHASINTANAPNSNYFGDLRRVMWAGLAWEAVGGKRDCVAGSRLKLRCMLMLA